MKRIIMEAGAISLAAELHETDTATAIWESLPLSAIAQTWGDEIYAEIPVAMPPATDARVDVEVGELGYWPMGQAFCVFFGPTPVSTGVAPRAYSPVNVIGRILGDAAVLRAVVDGASLRIARDE